MELRRILFSGATLCLSAFGFLASAQDCILPSLRVDGRYLKDTHGNIVNLHGVMDTPNPYFNNYRWGNRCDDSTVDDCLDYFDKIFDAVTDSTQGAWCNIFRLHLDLFVYEAEDSFWQVYHILKPPPQLKKSDAE